MKVETAAGEGATSVVSGLEQFLNRFVAGLYARLDNLGNAPRDLEALSARFAEAGTSGGLLATQIVLTVALVIGVYRAASRYFGRTSGAAAGWRKFSAGAAAVVLALVVGFVTASLLGSSGLPLRTLRVWTVVATLACLAIAAVPALLAPSASARRGWRVRKLSRDLSIALGWAMVGLGLLVTLRLWSAGPGLTDFIRTVLIAIPVVLLFAATALRNKRTLAGLVAGPRPRGRMRGRLARIWPATIIAFLVISMVATQSALTMGAPLPGGGVLLTLLIFLAAPHLNARIGAWSRRGLESPTISIAAAAGRETARFALIVAMTAMIGNLWAAPLAAGLGFDLRSVAREMFEMALIALAAAYLWNVIGVVTGRALQAEPPAPISEDESPSTPRSRLGTLIPLLSGVAKAAILSMALLSILASMGVNVWPLVTGLSVFGLAIGFGSQTLVKDVVSGLFFLIDDAFRYGEYIETSIAKGTVEKISIRSVSLRHQRGALATVPYGDIGKIQNLSRNWVIEKLIFRVAFDTDVEKLRKLFKKIGQDIQADPELAGDLLEPFKSQGIADVEDGTLVIRAKFKAKAGKQSMIRRAALTAVHRAFRENGIQAVPKPLTSTPAQGAAV